MDGQVASDESDGRRDVYTSVLYSPHGLLHLLSCPAHTVTDRMQCMAGKHATPHPQEGPSDTDICHTRQTDRQTDKRRLSYSLAVVVDTSTLVYDLPL
mmetsp:Transcript_35537/g.102129  ORF Transcript_35537/g.102129 Transcript_35537/m.102129 type:complete len:98 (+) Transcript_35537:2168-2461(+)